jgi:hypothetical protein
MMKNSIILPPLYSIATNPGFCRPGAEWRLSNATSQGGSGVPPLSQRRDASATLHYLSAIRPGALTGRLPLFPWDLESQAHFDPRKSA